MLFIKIDKNPDGSHAFQTGGALEQGWAIIPEDIEIPDTFPYVNIEVNDDMVVSMTTEEEIVPEMTIEDFRHMREVQCFPIVNRGTLWYERLSTEQKEELNIWYQAWLDVTETKLVPIAPEWLK